MTAGAGCATGKRHGVWRRLHQVLLERLQAAGEIDWSRATSTQRERAGQKRGSATGPNPTDRGKGGPSATLSPTRGTWRRSPRSDRCQLPHDSP